MNFKVTFAVTNGGVSSHVVAVVETDKGQVGHMRGKGQDEQDSHHAGHPRSPQTQCSDEKSVNRIDELTGSVITDTFYVSARCFFDIISDRS